MSLRITEEQKNIAVEEYARTGNKTKAAQAAKITRRTLQREGERNAAFKKDMENAKGIYTDELEAILDTRVKRAEYDKDKASAILLMFKLKAEMPDKYRDRIDHKVDGSVKIITGIPRPEKKQAGVAE